MPGVYRKRRSWGRRRRPFLTTYPTTNSVSSVDSGAGSDVASSTASSIGYATIGGSQVRISSRELYLSGPYTLSQVSFGRRIKVYCDAGNFDERIRGVIYQDNAGNPDTLIATTIERTITENTKWGSSSWGDEGWGDNTSQWVTLTFSPDPLLIAGDYWLGLWTGTEA